MNRDMKVLIIVAAALALYYFLLLPMEARREDMRAELREKHALLVKQERFLKTIKNGKTEVDKSRAELAELEKGVLLDPDASIAVARLQSLVQDTAAEAGLSVLYLKPLAPELHASYNTLHLFLDCTGGIEGLSRFLKALDARGNMMSVEKLTVNVGMGSGDLRVKVQVAALMKK